jgi:serine/threonine protein kinase
MSSTLVLPERHEAPTVGDRLGPYEILGRLGRGGMGLVFRAWDGRLHREVAIKLLHNEYLVPGSRERFIREARAASALNHPNICTIFDIGDREGAIDGAHYLIMELLQGETLKARIERGALPADEIVRCGMQIADALGAAHARGIVHRDIKPTNIFLVERADGGRQAKVLDFGLAQMSAPSAPSEASGGRIHRNQRRLGASSRAAISGDMTQDGATVGTVAYMSPEQARGDALDGRADLFSLGVVMYEMATRRVPFPGSTNEIAFENLMTRQPETVRDWNDTIPRGLEKVILQLLTKDPDGRFETAAEVSAALDAVAAKVSWSHSWRDAHAVPLVKAEEPIARKGPPIREHSSTGGSRVSLAAVPDGGAAVEPSIAAPMTESPRNEEFANVETIPPGRLARQRRRRLWFGAALLTVGAAWVFLGQRYIFQAPVLGPGDRLMIAAIENRTADQALDGTMERGLEIVLAHSSEMALTSDGAYREASRRAAANGGGPVTAVQARQAAQAIGAKAYLYGTLTENRNGDGRSLGYALSVKALDAATNRELASAAAIAGSRDQLLSAIDRVAAELRNKIGPAARRMLRGKGKSTEAGDLERQFGVPLSHQATGSIDALHWYSIGLAAELDRRTDAAARAYQSAVRLDPSFAQAQMRLASTYSSPVKNSPPN